jgi:cyanophycinase
MRGEGGEETRVQRSVARGRRPARAGRLLVIGGGEDPDEERMQILPHLVEAAGGRRARVLVCSSPSDEADGKARTYAKLFRRIGVAEVLEAPVANRAEAQEEEVVEAAGRASAVFFTGGDQLRLTAVLAGTPLGDRIRERLYGDSLVVAGTSAGAAAMSSVMIIGGPPEGTVRRDDVQLAPGLGYWRDTVIDTHFNQRGRVHRLVAIFAHNPNVLGIGIDENTAIDVVPGDRFAVLGEGAVMVFDGRVSHTNAPETAGDETIAVTDAVVHTLCAGYGFDLRARRPLRPDGSTVEAPVRE